MTWREFEAEVDGGFCGCEWPRLWPPHIGMDEDE